MATKLVRLINDVSAQKQDIISYMDTLPVDMSDILFANKDNLIRYNRLIGGYNDPQFTLTDLRDRIQAKIDINKGQGSIASVKNAIRYYLYGIQNGNTWFDVKDEPVTITQSNANLTAIVTNPNFNLSQARRIIDFVAAGVSLYIYYQPVPYFGFLEDTNPDRKGLDEGLLVELIQLN